MTFWPFTSIVFFWRLGLKTRFVRRKEKLTLWPNCFPLPVISHRDAIGHFLLFTTVLYYCFFHKQSSMKSCYTREVMELTFGYIGLVVVVVLISMTLHEAMHAFTSDWLGDDTARQEGRLTLNPLAHIDPFLTIGLPLFLAITSVLTQTPLPIFGGAKPVPFNPYRVRYGDLGAALVGLAGPFTNLVIAFVAYGFLALFPGLNEGIAGTILGLTVLVNLGFFIFNMLPIPPLDGSRALYAVAPDPVRRFMELIEQYGLIVVFAIVMLFSSQIGSFIAAVRDVLLAVFAAVFGVQMV